MSERINLGIALGAATGAMLAIGNLAPVTADASAGKVGKAVLGHTASVELDSVGPNFVSGQDLDNANLQLHVLLDEEGPDGCLAREIGQGLGITSQTQLEAVVASDNITFIKQQTLTSREAPGEIGCNGESPVKVANIHSSSVAYTIAANKIPSTSAKYVQKIKAGYVLLHELIDQTGEDAVLEGVSKLPKKHVSSNISVDVSYGISEDLAGVLPTAPMPVKTTLISGKNMSYTTFQADFQEDFNQAEAAAKPAAVTPPATEAPSEPAVPAPSPATPPTPPTSPTEPTPPTTPPTTPPPSGDPYTSGETGDDLGWPQCESNTSTVEEPDAAAAEAASPFNIVGANNGLVDSINPCLSAEITNAGSNLTIYVNTDWNSSSVYLKTTSPDDCATGDEDCAAYDTGYNNGLFDINAIKTATSTPLKKVWLDVEPPGVNTWSDDPAQNQNSLQGMYDAFTAAGIPSGAYGTTAGWKTLFGSFSPGWDSWGATTVSTAPEASTYCTGHEFTGGPTGSTLLIQFLVTNPETGAAEDKDYAC